MRIFYYTSFLIFVFLLTPQIVQAQACDTQSSGQSKPGSGFSCIEGGVENMLVEKPYAYPTATVQKNGAVFMTIKNTGTDNLRIISVESSIAEKIELHTTNMDGDIMMMREVGYYDIPASETVNFEPMGHHIMLIGLTKQLIKGEGFVINLNMEDGQSYVLNVPVKQMP